GEVQENLTLRFGAFAPNEGKASRERRTPNLADTRLFNYQSVPGGSKLQNNAELLEYYLRGGVFFVGHFVAGGPLAIFQIFSFHVKLTIRLDFTGTTHFGYTACAAFNLFTCDKFSIFHLQCSGRHILGGGKIIIRHHLLFFVPVEQCFATVNSLIDGV